MGKNLWGIFDFAVTSIGIIDTWIFTPMLWGSASGVGSLNAFTILRILRLLRIVRVIRIFRVCRELILLLVTLKDALVAVSWMVFLLLLVVYVGAVVCTAVLSPEVT